VIGDRHVGIYASPDNWRTCSSLHFKLCNVHPKNTTPECPMLTVGLDRVHLFGFSTTSRLYGEYLLNETRHTQPGKGVGKCKGFPTSSENFVNFGTQTG